MFAFSTPQEATTTIDSSTPFVAASDGNLSLLQQSLASLSVPASVTDSNGLTPLHSAVSYNQIDVIRWLLTQNVDVNAKDNDGDTPLHHCDHATAAKVLIEEGNADCKAKNLEGKMALETKDEELREMNMGMEEGDSDDEDKTSLEELVAYLKTFGL